RTPTPPEFPPHMPSLADLSRNASVISSSSSSSSTVSLVLPARPRPVRTFSSPRSRSPGGPPTPKASRPPAYITRELGIADQHPESPSGRSPNGRLSAEDFEFGDVLGEGSYSTVIHGTHRATKQEYAIKVLDKGHLKRNNKLHTALSEKNTLVRLGSGHPGIVRLHWAFQDDWSLYFVLDLARNGELQSRISRMGSLSTACARYYVAQLLMPSTTCINVADLKPENLLLDDDFRIKITDFGTGKLIDVPPERATKTFVGTAQYVSPELLEANETSKRCVFLPSAAGARSLANCTCGIAQTYGLWVMRDPLERLGAGPSGSVHSMDALRGHSFFTSIRWETLWDDPAPPLETGLVRRDPVPADEWDDVGAAWDELVGGPDGSDDEDEEGGSAEGPHGNSHTHLRSRVPGDDGIEWAPDAQVYVSPPAIPPEEIGPHGEIPDYAREALPLAEALEGVDSVDAVVAAGADVESSRSDRSTSTDATVSGNYGIHFALPGIDGVSKNTGTGAGEGTGLSLGIGPGPGLGSGSGPSPGLGPEKDKDAERDSPVSTSTETGGASGEGGAGEQPPISSAPLRVPRGEMRDSYATSSSDGSPVEKLGAALEAMGIHRGRLRTRSPTPARGVPEVPDWYALLFLPHVAHSFTTIPLLLLFFFCRASVLGAGETMSFHGPVEETALKRRTSRLLLPLPVSQRKPKVREFALTSHRLLCLKPLKNGRGVGVKTEFGLREAQVQVQLNLSREKRAKGDEVRGMVTGVERKSAKEFVVLTVRAISLLFLVPPPPPLLPPPSLSAAPSSASKES
ncbi:hypothetical protein B0F90DRAFT_1721495, partial [Multifurca ochricompacta]